jgi:raffinose/stachyose/melibiose transport system permease protein
MPTMRGRSTVFPEFRVLFVHASLLSYAVVAVFPIILVAMNSIKSRRAIFGQPLMLPTGDTLSFRGYETVWSEAHFPHYFLNSAVVTVGSLTLVILLGAMAAYALTELQFRGSRWLGLYLTLGLMIPIRLGTVAILRLIQQLELLNTLLALILVYVAMNLPIAILILSVFMRQVSADLKNAARIDGAGEYRILFEHVIPIIRPAIATVAVFTMIPVWNDLWFPLILAPSDETKTVILGAQQFVGQYFKDWNAMLAALTLSIVPTVIFYLIFSRQLIAGLTRGAIK